MTRTILLMMTAWLALSLVTVPVGAQGLGGGLPCLGDTFGDECDRPGCGDSVCILGQESCVTCPQDCGACQPTCVNPPSGLAAWWTFDSSTSFTYPDQVGSNYAFKNGNPGSTIGKVGNALLLDGVNDHLRVPDDNALDLGTGDFSVSLWARYRADSYNAFLLSKEVLTTPWPRGWNFHASFVGTAFFLRDQNDPGASHIAGSPNPADNRWHHLTFTVDRDNANGFKAYIDGVLRETGSPLLGNLTVDNAADLIIGATVDSTGNLYSFWQGAVDEVQIYKRALTGLEVSNLYQSGSAGVCRPNAPNFCPGGSACSNDLQCGFTQTFGLLGGCYQGSCFCK